jgi:hypothetical protein
VLGGGAYLAVTHIQCYTDISDPLISQVFVSVRTTILMFTPPPDPFTGRTEHFIYSELFFRHCERIFCFIVKMHPCIKILSYLCAYTITF